MCGWKADTTTGFSPNISVLPFTYFGSGSLVGIATDYGLDGPGIESRWGRDFPPVQTGPGAHPASCKVDTGSFPGVNCGRGVLLTTHPLLVPRSWKSRAIPLPILWVTGPVTGILYLFYLYLLFQKYSRTLSICLPNRKTQYVQKCNFYLLFCLGVKPGLSRWGVDIGWGG